MNGLALWKQTAFVAALFVVGAITGSVITMSVTREQHPHTNHPREISEHLLEQLRTRLGLTDEQIQKVKPTVAKASADMKVIYDDTTKRASAVMDTCYVQIGAVLTPEQKTKLEEMQTAHHRFPPGGPHGERDRHWRPRPEDGPLKSHSPGAPPPGLPPPQSVTPTTPATVTPIPATPAPSSPEPVTPSTTKTPEK